LGTLAFAKNAQAVRRVPAILPLVGQAAGILALRPGVDVLRVTRTTGLYRGMKTHHGVALTYEGRTLSTLDGREVLSTPGAVQLKEPGQVHRDVRRESPGTFQLVLFEPGLVDAARAALGLHAHAFLTTTSFAPGDARADVFRRLHEVVSAPANDLSSTAHAFALDAAVSESVTAFAGYLEDAKSAEEAGKRFRANVRRARAFILEHLAEPLTLDAVAEHARTDKFHLCRAFAAEVGLPPYAFLIQARVARARILLRRGVRPSDVAPMIGFCDQSQMHRHFVRIVGCTPGEYARG
jgi:AraC-like DNA-binding protein